MARDLSVCAIFLLLGLLGLPRLSSAVWVALPASGTKCVSEEIHSNVVVVIDYGVIPPEDRIHDMPTVSSKHDDLGLGAEMPGRGSSKPHILSSTSIRLAIAPFDGIVFKPKEQASLGNRVKMCMASSINKACHFPPLVAQLTSPYGNTLHEKHNSTIDQFAFTTTEAGNYLACFWLDPHLHPIGGATINIDWKIGIAAKDWDSVAKKEKIEGVELELRKLEGAVEAIHENLLYLRSREAEMREVSETTNARVAWFSIMSLGVCIGASGFQLWYLKRYFQKKKLI
ncbi:hypothetical protein ACLOJK_016565 [Asimina triloba]